MTGDNISKVILSRIKKIELPMQRLVAQSYDRAASMSLSSQRVGSQASRNLAFGILFSLCHARVEPSDVSDKSCGYYPQQPGHHGKCNSVFE